MSFLPPVVITVEWDDKSALAGVARDNAVLDEFAAKSDATMRSAGGSMKGLSGDSSKYLAGDVAGNIHHVGDKMDETATRVSKSSGRMKESVEDAAAALGAALGNETPYERAARAADNAEKDVESKSKGFSGRIAGVFNTVGNSMSSWGIPFGHTVSNMGSKIDEAEKKGGGFKQSLESIGKVATALGGVALVGVAAESVHMADEFDVAQGQLQNAIKNTGGSFSAVKPQIEATYGQMAKFGFNSTETARALSALTISTKSPTTAMHDMGVAADLARAKNMSLESATAMLTKVYAGSQRALISLGLNLDVGTGKLKTIRAATESVASAHRSLVAAQEAAAEATGTKAPAAARKLEAAQLALAKAEHKLRMDQHATADILAAVKARTEGAARAYGETLAGQMKAAGAQVHNLAVNFGEMLMPAIKAAIGVIASITGYLVKHKEVALILAGVIVGPLVAAIGVYVGSMIAANAATLGIGAVVGLLAVGIFELATHWQAAANWMHEAFEKVLNWIKSHWMVILAVLIAPIAPVISAFLIFHKQIEAGFTKTVSWIVGAWHTVENATLGLVKSVVHFFSTLPSKVMATIEGLPGDIAKLWQTIISGVGNLISGVVHFFATLPSKVVTAVQALPGDMLKLGEEIMHAIISGVEHLASAFVGTIKKVILGPIEAAVGAIEGLFGGGGGGGGTLNTGTHVKGEFTTHGALASGPGSASQGMSIVELEALWIKAGGPKQVAKTAAEIAIAESGGRSIPNTGGSGAEGIWQIKGADSPGNLMNPEVNARNAVEKYKAAGGFTPWQTYDEGKVGSGGGGASSEALKKLRETLTTTPATAGANSIKEAIGASPSTGATKGVKGALEQTPAKTAAETLKHTIETAKLNLSEAKKVFSTAFSELAKLSEKLLKYTLAKGGAKTAELTGLERAHEEGQNAAAVAAAEENLRKAEGDKGTDTAEKALEAAKRKQAESESKQAEDEEKVAAAKQKLLTAETEKRRGKGSVSSVESAASGVASAEGTVESAKGSAASSREATANAEEGLGTARAAHAAEVKSAQEALANALYTVKVAGLKKEAAAEEAAIAKQNAAKESAFTHALAQLKTHLEKGKLTTKQAMADIEKVLKHYGITFGTVGKDAGKAWVKQFETEIKKAALDAGGLGDLIRKDLSAGLHIPGLAAGGIVTSPTLAVIGEAGPEAVVPLSGLSTTQPGPLPLGGGATVGKTVTLNATLYTNATTSEQTISEMYQRLRPLLMGV